jgi:hypothetical protein
MANINVDDTVASIGTFGDDEDVISSTPFSEEEDDVITTGETFEYEEPAPEPEPAPAPKGLGARRTSVLPETEAEGDRLSTFLRSPEMFEEKTRKEMERMDFMGVDEFSQEMESMYGESTETEKDFSIEEMASSPAFIRLASNYLTKRIGKEEGDVRNYDNNEDFVRRYLSHTRALEDNMGAVANELSYIKTLSFEEANNVGKLYQLNPHIMGATSKGGDTILNALQDHALYMAGDPANVISLGSGWLVKSLAGKVVANQTIKQALKSQMAAIGGTGALEGTLGYMENADRQSLEILTNVRKNQTDVSKLEALGAGALQGSIGMLFPAMGTNVARTAPTAAEKLEKELLDKKASGKIVDEQAEIKTGAINEEQARKELLYDFDAIRGIVARDKLQTTSLKIAASNARESDLVSPQVNSQIVDDVTRVIGEWMSRNEEVASQVNAVLAKDEGKISDVVSNLFARNIKKDGAEDGVEVGIQNVDASIYTDLDDALAAAGVTKEEFGQAMRGTVSEAGRVLRSYSELTKQLKKMGMEDPGTARLVSDLFAYEAESGMGFWTRLDAESRGIMVSGLGTTVANVFGGLGATTFGTAANVIESTLYHAGRATKAMANGEMSWEATKTGAADMMKDSFGLLYNLARQGRSDALSDAALATNQGIKDRLFHMTNALADESKDKELSAFTKALNTLNIAQDRFFRRAIFADRVDFYLRRASKMEGSDVKGGLEYYLANNLPIPTAVLKRSSEDALKMTFAYMPKEKGLKAGFEGNAETIAHHFVQITEKLPFIPVIGTGEFPFARFMTNAIAYQYKYSPINAGAYKDVTKMAFKRDMSEAEALAARSNVSKAVVGAGAFAAAVGYRMDHQEMAAYEIEDDMGRPIDARRAFPVVGFLVLADAYVKLFGDSPQKFEWKDFAEGVTGAQMKAGQTQGVDLVSNIVTQLSSEGFDITDWETWDMPTSSVAQEKLGDIIGKYVANQFGRVLTPTQMVSDVIASGDEEEAVIRDANQIEGKGFGERALDSFTKQLLYKVPYAKRTLPPLESPTREGGLYKENLSMRSIIPVRIQSIRNPIETELSKYGYSTSSLIPKTQDGVARSMYAELIAPLVDNFVGGLISSDRYDTYTDAQKKNAINAALGEAKNVLTKGSLGLDDVVSIQRKEQGLTYDDAVARGVWLAMPANDRRLVEDLYKENGTPSVMESRDFRSAIKLVPFLKRAYR